MAKKVKRAIDPSAPGTTKQDVMTPAIFIQAVQRIIFPAILEIDLAASFPNVCDIFIDESMDSLSMSWRDLYIEPGNYFWLNPPFSMSKLFIRKAKEEKARIMMLVQTAFGSDYWSKNIAHNKFCRVICLTGRVPFVGYDNGANIDCSLIEWGEHLEHLMPHERLLIWDWRNVDAVPIPFMAGEAIAVGPDGIRCHCAGCSKVINIKEVTCGECVGTKEKELAELSCLNYQLTKDLSGKR